MSFDALIEGAQGLAVTIGSRVVGAIVLWIIGKFVIRLIKGFLDAALKKFSQVDETMSRYLGSALGIFLNIILVVLILGVFGVETTTLAGLLAAVGVAIGMAWSGLLANFAAGIFLVILRPFRVGDLIDAGGTLGIVREIGLFVTVVDTLDNVRTIIGNNKVFSANIQNFSANDFRRVDLKAQLAHGADHKEAVKILKEAISKVDNVLDTPAPDIEILDFNLAGPVLAVRPYCSNDHYWQVYFDTNAAIRDELGKAGFPVPEQHFQVASKG